MNLRDNCIGLDCQDGLIHLADALQFMTSLDLSHNALGKHDSQQGTVRLAEILTTNTTVTADMGWRVHSAFAVLAWQGKVSFNIRIYGAAQGVTLEVGWVSIAAIGGQDGGGE